MSFIQKVEKFLVENNLYTLATMFQLRYIKILFSNAPPPSSFQRKNSFEVHKKGLIL